MTPDPLQERVARVLALQLGHTMERVGDEWRAAPNTRRIAAAVLADLREAGELRTLEQVGWYCEGTHEHPSFCPDEPPVERKHMRGLSFDDGCPIAVPVYIVREDNTPKVCEVCGGRGWVLQPGSIQKGEPCPRGCKPDA